MENCKTQGTKARWKLHKNAMFSLQQILEATPCKTADVQPLNSHLKNHPSKMTKTCGSLLIKQEQAHQQHSSMVPYTRTCQCCQSARTYISFVKTLDVVWRICPGVMNDRDGWREKEREKVMEIYADNM